VLADADALVPDGGRVPDARFDELHRRAGGSAGH
jgi:hypothetical protein